MVIMGLVLSVWDCQQISQVGIEPASSMGHLYIDFDKTDHFLNCLFIYSDYFVCAGFWTLTTEHTGY